MTTWTDTTQPSTPYLNTAMYPVRTDTRYDDLIEFDNPYMTYDGVLLSSPGWTQDTSVSSPWLAVTPIVSTWTPDVPPETPWT